VKHKHISASLDRYRITDGAAFKLKHYDPADQGGMDIDKADADALLAEGVARLSELQTRLYAQDRWALLAAFQAMDAAGKDGTIKHVMTGINPQGVQVVSFKQPGPDALDHDFLWRIHEAVPPRGRIGIFNRSQYEEVLVCRVHPELLDKQMLPNAVRGRKFWKHRLEDIAAFERYLARQGVAQVKFFLHLSKDEQKRRFLARIDTPDKNWKFSAGDLKERAFWDEYQDTYEETIAATASVHAPWYVVPADHKWFTHLIVVNALIEALEALDLKAPEAPPAQVAELQAARASLEAE
jgi:PPK2 family polyphosphate:nucleotide phosphotransferase